MRIDDYLKSRDETAAAYAKKVGVSPSNISKYRAGKLRPKDKVMSKIIEVTGGLVTPNDFYNLPHHSAYTGKGVTE